MLNNSNDKLFSTDNLDDAMKELLDICQQYNDKLSNSTQQSRNKSPHNVNVNYELKNNKQKTLIPIMNKLINDKSNVTQINTATRCDKDVNEQNGKSAFQRYQNASKDAFTPSNSRDFSNDTDSISGSVERLQQRQSELQIQLDEVIKTAKDLELKQKKRLNILPDESNKNRQDTVSDEEDSELIEFQQIENELRLSELNRQLSNIQEELRLRLYKRLMSKTTGGSKTTKERNLQAEFSSFVDESLSRRKSTPTNESTPPSSSCSNDRTVSSCISTSDLTNSNVKAFVETDLVGQFEQCLISKKIDISPNQNSCSSKKECEDLTGGNVTSKLDTIDSKTISRTNSMDSTKNQTECDNRTYDLKPALKHGHDLGRIDEGEEDDSDYYANSNVFRSIYEEKISPMILAANNRNDHRFNTDNINSAKRSNRPLTIYMPKSDDDVDLVKLVQSQGHDLDIISADLRITPVTAHGYLYKSCSSNSKKWLKRYFYYDRSMKTLSYYENEEQLVKKSNAPKCIIPFDEIGDVYVDHRLSELSEKQKGSKRKSYVFILATIKRKYVLASSKAETMRAWIDILFKAARANDYFNEIENDEYLDSLDPS